MSVNCDGQIACSVAERPILHAYLRENLLLDLHACRLRPVQDNEILAKIRATLTFQKSQRNPSGAGVGKLMTRRIYLEPLGSTREQITSSQNLTPQNAPAKSVIRFSMEIYL
jgi:hypothetical protein